MPEIVKPENSRTEMKKIKKGEIKLVKNTAVLPGEAPTDAYLARAAALKFELQNFHRLAAPPKLRDLAPIKRQTRIQAKHITPLRQHKFSILDNQAESGTNLDSARNRSMLPPTGRIREKNALH